MTGESKLLRSRMTPFLYFTLSGLIAHAVVITELHESADHRPLNTAEQTADSFAFDVAPETGESGLQLTRSHTDTVRAASNTERSILEAIRGFCVICQRDDMLLTHPKTNTCIHKFCEECFSRFADSTVTGSLRCPVCRTLLANILNDPSDESDEVETLERSIESIRRRMIIKRYIFMIVSFTLCGLGIEAFVMTLYFHEFKRLHNVSNSTSSPH